MSRYTHTNNEYFRLALCENCGQATYHKPVSYRRRSGLNNTFWVCEHCHIEELIIHPVQNEIEIFGNYVKQHYIDKDKDDESS